MGLEEFTSDEIYREAERRLAAETLESESINLVRFDDVVEEEITWLYQPYVPRGKITLCAAYPGVGKTYLLCYMAACVSAGKQFFDITPFDTTPENVLYLTSEDGLGDTLKKRLRLCGADMKRIYSIDSSVEAITFDSPKVEQMIKQVHPALLIFDPFQSYIGENVEMNAANKTRAQLNNLVYLAEKYNVAVVLICHFNKNQKGDAITRIIGSTDIVGVSRSYLALGKVPDDDEMKYMSHEKSSLDKRGKTILFRINPEAGGIQKLGESLLSMDDYVKQANENRRKLSPALEEAKAFIKEQMPTGERRVAEIKNLASANHISDRTLERARKELGIISRKEGFGGQFTWILPRDTA